MYIIANELQPHTNKPKQKETKSDEAVLAERLRPSGTSMMHSRVNTENTT